METITDIRQIDLTTKEGQYLWAALVMLTTEFETNRTPYHVLAEITNVRDKIKDAIPA